MEVQNAEAQLVFDETYGQLPARSANGGWIANVDLEDGFHRVQIHIDDHLAYQNLLFVGEALF